MQGRAVQRQTQKREKRGERETFTTLSFVERPYFLFFLFFLFSFSFSFFLLFRLFSFLFDKVIIRKYSGNTLHMPKLSSMEKKMLSVFGS